MLQIAGGIILALVILVCLPFIFEIMGVLVSGLIVVAMFAGLVYLVIEEPVFTFVVLAFVALLYLISYLSSLKFPSPFRGLWQFFDRTDSALPKPSYLSQEGALQNLLENVKLSLRPAFTDTKIIEKQRALGANLKERGAILGAMEAKWEREISEHSAYKREYANQLLNTESQKFQSLVAARCSAYVDEGLLYFKLQKFPTTTKLELSDREGKQFAKAQLTVEERSPSKAILRLEITDSSGEHLCFGFPDGVRKLKAATRKHIKESPL